MNLPCLLMDIAHIVFLSFRWLVTTDDTQKRGHIGLHTGWRDSILYGVSPEFLHMRTMRTSTETSNYVYCNLLYMLLFISKRFFLSVATFINKYTICTYTLSPIESWHESFSLYLFEKQNLWRYITDIEFIFTFWCV